MKSILLYIMFLVSIPVYGKTIYVSQSAAGAKTGVSWSDAFIELQDAMDSAEDGDDVWVAEGTYKPTLENGPNNSGRDISFQMKNKVAIYGGFPDTGNALWNDRNPDSSVTTLSGEIGDEGNSSDNCYSVFCHTSTLGLDSTAIIDGFTITGGNANGRGNGSGSGTHYDSGSGMFNQGCSPTVRNCTFINNTANNSGGGMYNIGCSPRVVNCIFTDNSAEDYGGGIASINGDTYIAQCLVKNCSSDSRGGGIYFGDSSGCAINCIIINNSGGWGGGINCTDSTSVISNCTIVGNSSEGAGGIGSYSYQDKAQISNCIVWNNIPDEIGYTNQVPNITYSFIKNGWPGEDNINSDPYFIDVYGPDNILGTDDDDLRLMANSPCIDSGSNNAIPGDIFDLDKDGDTSEPVPYDFSGTTRTDDTPDAADSGQGATPIVDMGAYELSPGIFELEKMLISVPEGGQESFTVALKTNPGMAVEVNVSIKSGDGDISVKSGNVLMFDSQNYMDEQTVTLQAAEDGDKINGFVEISLQMGVNSACLVATESDNEPNPSIIYVDCNALGLNNGADWENAYTCLQDALSLVKSNKQLKKIYIAKGTYYPAKDRTNKDEYFNLVDGVTIEGGYAGVSGTDPDARDIELYRTILSGDLAGNDSEVGDAKDLIDHPDRTDNSNTIVIAENVSDKTILDGITITGGNEAGIKVNVAGYPTLKNCVISGNVTSYRGGAVCILTQNSSITLDKCVIDKNASKQKLGGGIYSTNAKLELTDCTISNNYGGGIYQYCSSITLNSCVIKNNFIESILDPIFFVNYSKGGGIYNLFGDVLLKSCEFTGNQAGKGGGIYVEGCDAELVNCYFNGNIAHLGGASCTHINGNQKLVNCVMVNNHAIKQGGAIYNWGNSMLHNCTLYKNSSELEGGGIHYHKSNPYPVSSLGIFNSILWENFDSGGSDEYSQISTGNDVTINNSCIQNWSGTLGGSGNIPDDPMFKDPEGPDNILGTDDDKLILSISSPCIDAGSNDALPEDTLDIDNDGNTDEKVPLDFNFNIRMTDIPWIADSGPNASPVVDMGAFECVPVPSLKITETSLLVSEGASADFGVSLSLIPPNPVSVNIAIESGDSDISITSPFTLNFDKDNYSIVQNVSVLALEDEDWLDGQAIISISANGMQTVKVLITEVDNEPTPNRLYVDAGASGRNDGSKWIDALTCLNTALILAAENMEIKDIWVAQGTYKSTDSQSNRRATFLLKSDLNLYGGFPSGGGDWVTREPSLYKTILSGDISGNDSAHSDDLTLVAEDPNRNENCFHVLTAENVQNATLDGFIIASGHASSSEHHHSKGGGILIEGGDLLIANCEFAMNYAINGAGAYNLSSEATYSNCRFTENVAFYNGSNASGGGLLNDGGRIIYKECGFENNFAKTDGGGMHVTKGAVVELTGCEFNRNTAGAGGAISSYDQYSSFPGKEKSTAILRQCVMSNNSSLRGGAIRVYSGKKYMFSECTFITNQTQGNGGAIELGGAEEAVFSSCIFNGNTSSEKGGAVYLSAGDSDMSNCLFAKNKAETGGAVYSAYGKAHLTNNTFASNLALPDGASIYNNHAKTTLTNCILWGDSSSQISSYRYGDKLNASYCNIQGDKLWPGEGNISLDPLFVDPAIDDYRLMLVSPCIDAGVDVDVTTDIKNNPRPVDYPGVDNNQGTSAYDMGAYEMIPPLEVDIRFTPRKINPKSNGKWLKVHFFFPRDYSSADVDLKSGIRLEPCGILATSVKLTGDNETKSGIVASFKREDFCYTSTDIDIDLKVTGCFMSGQNFYGLTSARITSNALKNLAKVAEHWLQSDCKKPSWCDGADSNQDSKVNLSDVIKLGGCGIEILGN